MRYEDARLGLSVYAKGDPTKNRLVIASRKRSVAPNVWVRLWCYRIGDPMSVADLEPWEPTDLPDASVHVIGMRQERPQFPCACTLGVFCFRHRVGNGTEYECTCVTGVCYQHHAHTP